MKPKSGFSPWHTKQNSFQQDQTPLPSEASHKNNLHNYQKSQKKSQSKMSSRKKVQEEQQPMLRSFSKTESLGMAFLEDSGTMGFRRRVTRSSQKIECEGREERSGKKFDDEKWRILTITSNDRFKSECAQLRKHQHLASQLKSRRSSLRHTPLTQQKQKPQKPPLQQVSIKNFIIHGHYTDKESLFMLGKRRDAAHVMKQKFATLKKTIESKENCEGRRVVVVRSSREQQQKEENLFRVIKIEREINASNNRVL